MPDLSFCININCESRLDCARYMGKPSRWQLYMVDFIEKLNKCDMFFKSSEAYFKLYSKSEMKRIEKMRNKQ